jgi:CrcB protein
MTLLLVLLGGGLGAPSRYLLDRWVQSRHRGQFPWGTLLVNLIGCLLLGIVTGGLARHGWSDRTFALLGTGFCGGLTTFSTFSAEVVELLRGRFSRSALGYLVLSCGLGYAAVAAGYALA